MGCSDSSEAVPADTLDGASGMAGSSSDASSSSEATGSADVGTGSGGSVSPEAMPLGDAAVSVDTGASTDGPLPDRLIVATGQSSPTGITVDDTYVYFANRDDGTIVRCPHAGCGTNDAKILVTGQDKPIALAQDGTDLYWVTGWRMGQSGSPLSRPIFRCALPDCATDIQPFDRGTYQPYEIAVTADKVFLSAWPTLGSCAKTGCTGTSATIASGPYVSVDADAATLYRCQVRIEASRELPAPWVLSRKVDPRCDRSDERGNRRSQSLHRRFRFLPFSRSGCRRTPRILRCPLAGCTAAALPEVVESGDITPYALAEHGDRLYFTNVQQGTVISRRKP